MANKYVWSGAAGAGTGADWTNAYTTLTAAFAGGAAGDDFWVADDHAESQATAMTLTGPGTDSTPCRVICALRSGGSVPPVAADMRTTATITTTGNNAMSISGYNYYYGITFSAGSGAVAAILTLGVASGVSTATFLENCALKKAGTSVSTAAITAGTATSSTAQAVTLVNTTMQFGNTGDGIAISNSRFRWRDTPSAIAGATIPTSLFRGTNGFTGDILVSGVDFSALGAGTIVAVIGSPRHMVFSNCRLGASAVLSATQTERGGARTKFIGCDSGTGYYRNELYDYAGTLTTETTIKRTNGASDGTTGYSHKVVTSAGAVRTFPFESFTGEIWNATTGAAKTLTIHTLTDNVTLTDAEIWVEVEYLGSASYPIASLIDDANATVLTTAANQATSTATWTTTGIGTPVYQKLEVTFTPNMVGAIKWRVYVAKASATVYFCPKAEIA